MDDSRTKTLPGHGETRSARPAGGRAAPRPSRLAGLLVALREMPPSGEPSVVFDALAEVCVQLFCDIVRISVVEDGAGTYHLARGGGVNLVTAAGDPTEVLDIVAARHEVTDTSVVVPVSAPALDQAPSYRGRFVAMWDEGHRPDLTDLAVAQAAVDHAVGVVHRTRLTDQIEAWRTRAANLEVALASNREIGAAIGILMGLSRLTREQAFEQLRRASMARNVKLHALAAQVVETGSLEPR